jgi:hypothetical protein
MDWRPALQCAAMSSWSRLLVVCALMLALPLKVLAGVGLGCADGGHGPAPTVAAGLAQDAVHAGHDHAAHDHIGAAQAPGHAFDAPDESSTSGCSHCAPCCAAALPAADPQRLPAVHPEPQSAWSPPR